MSQIYPIPEMWGSEECEVLSIVIHAREYCQYHRLKNVFGFFILIPLFFFLISYSAPHIVF